MDWVKMDAYAYVYS